MLHNSAIVLFLALALVCCKETTPQSLVAYYEPTVSVNPDNPEEPCFSCSEAFESGYPETACKADDGKVFAENLHDCVCWGNCAVYCGASSYCGEVAAPSLDCETCVYKLAGGQGCKIEYEACY